MDNSRICHHLLFHERVSGNKAIFRAAISLVNEATKVHTRFNTEVMEFLTLMSVDHVWTCLKRTQLQYVICTV